MNTQCYPAPAKVNLHLAITGKTDTGYHTLDTSFVFVDVCDTLVIQPASALTVRCDNAAIDGENNLVYQVLAAFRKQFAVRQGLDVRLEKKLPAQAGLGGGSSDAATALMVANRMWGVHADMQTLIAFATPFGADIPCFLYGKASQAYGVGDALFDYEGVVPTQPVVVAWPGVGVSTAEAFARFAKKHALTDKNTAATVRARSGDAGFALGYNDLEAVAISLCPPMADMLARMRRQSELAWMSGSGSACVAICASDAQALMLATDLQKHKLAAWVHQGRFLVEHPLGEQHIGA